METTVVWIVIFAGATIGLLGLFLFASERELKVKRRELESLSAKLNGSSSAQSDESAADRNDLAIEPAAELTTRNKELSAQLAALTARLHQSETQVADLQDAELRLSSMQTEVAQLHSSYQRLQDENSRLRNQFLETQERFQEASAMNPELSKHYSHMESEIRELSEELEKSWARIRELETEQKRFSEFHNSALREHQSLVAKINELENELENEKQKLIDFDFTRSRLSDIEGRYVALNEQNARLREEISRCEEELSQSQQHRHQLSLARQHLDQLELGQAMVTEHQEKIQQQLAALGKVLGAVSQEPLQVAHGDDRFQKARRSIPVHAAEYGASTSTEHTGDVTLHSRDDENKATANNEQQAPPDDSHSEERILHSAKASTHPNGKQGYKVLVVLTPALLVFGTVMAGFLRNDSTESEVTVATTPMIKSMPTDLANTGQSEKANSLANDASSASGQKRRATQVSETAGHIREAQVKTVAVTSSALNHPVDESVTGKSNVSPARPIQPRNRPSPSVWGGYEIVRSTQVYTEPTENSQLVDRLSSGARVNVVSARDGWLEIRSKNGRPPGFIKSDTAVRIEQN
jgi:predicted nuclease with TOPRIM domain